MNEHSTSFTLQTKSPITHCVGVGVRDVASSSPTPTRVLKDRYTFFELLLTIPHQVKT